MNARKERRRRIKSANASPRVAGEPRCQECAKFGVDAMANVIIGRPVSKGDVVLNDNALRQSPDAARAAADENEQIIGWEGVSDRARVTRVLFAPYTRLDPTASSDADYDDGVRLLKRVAVGFTPDFPRGAYCVDCAESIKRSPDMRASAAHYSKLTNGKGVASIQIAGLLSQGLFGDFAPEHWQSDA